MVIIAFCFGALLEALAGFGTPVAICGVMMVGLGFRPIKAVAVALVADTAPVAFGAIAIPIITLAQVTELPKHTLSQMVGRQVPFLALLVPFVLVFMVDGRRGLRDSWPAALVAGAVFAVVQFTTLQLHLHRAHGYLRLARLRRRAGGPAARVVAPRPRGQHRARGATRGAGHRRRRAGRRRVRAPCGHRRGTAAEHRRDASRFPALHHHHRGARGVQPSRGRCRA